MKGFAYLVLKFLHGWNSLCRGGLCFGSYFFGFYVKFVIHCKSPSYIIIYKQYNVLAEHRQAMIKGCFPAYRKPLQRLHNLPLLIFVPHFSHSNHASLESSENSSLSS